MGNVEYTQEQLKVIQTHKRNLLVSAAAGSGKTAVLVERIVQMVTDEKAPLDIDKLLVVTFTNAAAAEMRERISDALEKKLDQNPHLKHLHRQLVLLSNANIMTIHAFCLKVIRNNFNTIGLDPSFKIGDENELLLLKSEVIKELLEEKYAEGDPLFLRFIESYAGSKSDEIIEELIMTTHRFATSNPWPEEWLYKSIENLNIHTTKEFEDTQYYKNLKQITKETLQTVEGLLLQAQGIIHLEDGPIHYKEAVEIYLDHLYTLYELLPSGYEEIQKCLLQFESPKLSQKRTGFDEALKERGKSAIDKAKELLQELREVYYAYPITDVLSDIFGTYEVLKVLGDLTNEFARNYQKIKEEKNLIDFNDIEHFALNILVQKDPSGQTISTEVAKDYRNQFEEILIDEYQDSNLVQETLLTSVSREQDGTPNFFMVGDVKQSIYKFRL
ncbi:MAG: UvrD-helicase domain-containing protein, partial [Vallitaleaceae bacterium]|nr:UvrD-helicase domain-containing protein [Vallitaleaceae bacterium]